MRTHSKPVIDYTRVADGFLFDTHRLRCQYLGKTTREKPAWLEQHKGKFKRLEDVEREAASLAAPVESEVNVIAASSAPNSQMSARKDGDDEDDVALVDTLTEDRSPPHEPASPPTPVNENVPSEPTQAELQPPAKAALMKTKAPKTGATPVGAKGRKQGRSGGRRGNKQKSPAKVTNARDKLSPERMRVVLDSLSERPIQSDAARAAGICRKTLEYWIKRSKAGDDGYDIEHEGVTMRFHIHCEWSKEEARDKVLEAAYLNAMGKAYTTDENGNLTL
jgi:hypothetical protein